MPIRPLNEIKELEVSDAEAATGDSNAMADLMEKIPVVEPNASSVNDEPPASSNRGPNDPLPPEDDDSGAGEPTDEEKEEQRKADEAAAASAKKPEDEAAAAAAAKTEDAALEEEVEKELADVPKLPENAPKHAKDAVTAMRRKVSTLLKGIKKITGDRELTQKERDDFAKKLEDLQTQYGDPKDIEDARAVRRAVAIERDPEFIERYTNPIKQHEEAGVGLLSSIGLPKEVADWITASGGLTAFYYSKELVSDPKTGQPLIDKETKKPITESEWFKKYVLGSDDLSEEQRDDVIDHIKQARSLSRARVDAIEAAKKDGQKYIESRQKQAQEIQAKFVQEEKDAIIESAKALGTHAMRLTPKPDATPEQKANIKAHNERIDKSEAAFKEYMNDRTPTGRGRMVVAAAQSVYLGELASAQQDRIKELETLLEKAEEKITGIKKAGQTRNRVGAVPSKAAPTVDHSKASDDETAMSHLMETVVDGKGA